MRISSMPLLVVVVDTVGVGSGMLPSVLIEATWSAEVLYWEEAAIDENRKEDGEDCSQEKRT